MLRTTGFPLIGLLVVSTACGTDEGPLIDVLDPQGTPRTVECKDAAILELKLQLDPAPGEISNTDDAGIWHSTVDATAGGAFTATPDSFVYAAFTDQGLAKIAISDEEAFDVPAWDIAFRRYILRINSGDSGIGSTHAVRMPPGIQFENLTAGDVPTGLTPREDDYFTDAPSCEFINDGSGLDGSPATAMAGYYSYVAGNPGCVQMTYTTYVLETAADRHVKVMVTHYYNQGAQQICQTDPGSFSPMGAGSGNIQLRWAFLD